MYNGCMKESILRPVKELVYVRRGKTYRIPYTLAVPLICTPEFIEYLRIYADREDALKRQ